MAATSTRAKPVKPAEPAVVAKFGRDLKAVTRRVDAREKAAAEANADRDRVIRDAHAAGVTPSQIASFTGLTPQRIDQIRRSARL
jgi:hypothetical protein